MPDVKLDIVGNNMSGLEKEAQEYYKNMVESNPLSKSLLDQLYTYKSIISRIIAAKEQYWSGDISFAQWAIEVMGILDDNHLW